MATRYAGILRNCGLLVFLYNVVDETYVVYETAPGVSDCDEGWQDRANCVLRGHVDCDHSWDLFKAICVKRDAAVGEGRDAQWEATRERLEMGG